MTHVPPGWDQDPEVNPFTSPWEEGQPLPELVSKSVTERFARAPGWYPDPTTPTRQQRYFDGEQWGPSAPTAWGAVSAAPMTSGAPGWHPDPAGSGLRRYFDGNQWGPMEPVGWTAAAAYPPAVPYINAVSPWMNGGYSTRSGVAAGLLQLFLGWFGIGRFYLGYNSIGAVQLSLGIVGLLLTLLCGIGVIIIFPLSVWAIVDAIMMFTGAVPDADGLKLR